MFTLNEIFTCYILIKNVLLIVTMPTLILLSSWATVGCSRRTWLHDVRELVV